MIHNNNQNCSHLNQAWIQDTCWIQGIREIMPSFRHCLRRRRGPRCFYRLCAIVSLIVSAIVILYLAVVTSPFFRVPTRHVHCSPNMIYSTNSTTTNANKTNATTATKRPWTQDSYLSCKLQGGLGNRLFIYASAYGIASYTNRTLLLNDNNLLVKNFNISAKLVPASKYRRLMKKFRFKAANRHCSYDQKLYDLPKGNANVGGYMQSYKYFEHVAENIRHEFSFRKSILNNARKIIDKSVSVFLDRTNSSSAPVLIGVHIRRGDLVNNSHGYDVATPEYMNKSAEYFRQKYGRVLFLVCSNGMDWTRENIHGDDVVYIERNDAITDMAVLVSCNHILSTVGSFSWWAGYLAGGDVLYYQWPARNGTRLRKHFSKDFSDFFPPLWIGLS